MTLSEIFQNIHVCSSISLNSDLAQAVINKTVFVFCERLNIIIQVKTKLLLYAPNITSVNTYICTKCK